MSQEYSPSEPTSTILPSYMFVIGEGENEKVDESIKIYAQRPNIDSFRKYFVNIGERGGTFVDYNLISDGNEVYNSELPPQKVKIQS